MPIFDYRCSKCQQSVELIVGFSDNDHVWHNCLDNGQGECELTKCIGATETTFRFADRRAKKTSTK